MKSITFLLASLALLLLSGCLSSQGAAKMDANAFKQRIPVVHVMPVIDARRDKSGELDAGDLQRIRDSAKGKLEDQGYQTVVVDSWRKITPVSDEELANMDDAALCRLAPEDSSVFLVVTIDNVVDTYAGITSSYSITGTFSLVDRAKAAAIWKNTGTGSHSMGGIIGSVVSEADKRLEAQTALVSVLSSVPKNQK